MLFIKCTVILFILSLLHAAECLILSEETFKSEENWEFLRRFCFLDGATLNITIEFPYEFRDQKMLFYPDGINGWSQAYKTPKTCREKVSILDEFSSKVQVMNENNPNCYFDNPSEKARKNRKSDYTKNIHCKYNFEFVVSRPTWWFIAMSNCNKEDGLYATYDMIMKNGDTLMDRHFSCDEISILPAIYAVFVIYVLLVALVAYFLHLLNSKHKIVHIYAILMASILFNGIYLFIAAIYWTSYGYFGQPNRVIRSCSYGFHIIGHSLFIVVLLFLSVGYCVVFTMLTKVYILIILIVGSSYMILQMVVYIFQEGNFDPGLVVYRSETPFGIVLEILRIVILVIFLVSCGLSAKKFTKKRKFFIVYAVIFGLWFISIPIMVLLSSLMIVDYVREKVVVIFDFAIMALGHILLIILTRPTVGNRLVTFMKSATIGVTLEEAETRDN